MRIARFFLPFFLGFAGCASSSPDASLSTPIAASSSPVAPSSSPVASPGSSVAAPSSLAAAPSLAPETPAAPEPKASAPAPSPEVAKTFGAASNLFATELYASLRGKPGNLAVSPASISLALMMTWGGAKTDTADEMAKVLHLAGPVSSERDAWLKDAGRQLSTWNDPKRTTYTLAIANRLFGEMSYAFDPAYIKKTADIFGAPLQPVDFVNASEPARELINAWAAKQTRDRIKDLLPPRSLDEYTRLVLVNAIYFLGKWEVGFNKASTRTRPFFMTAATSKDVPTMHQQSDLKYASVDGLEVLEMPYKGGDMAMTLVLPRAKDGLDALEQRLTHARLTSWIAAASRQKVNVALPRFKIDPPGSISLSKQLSAMGMPLAFNSRQADFTGMAKPRSERLYITEVFHKAFVLVDEEGTEAAAATAVVMGETRGMNVDMPASFQADHPFLFFLRDLKSGTILFMGRVVDPAAK